MNYSEYKAETKRRWCQHCGKEFLYKEGNIKKKYITNLSNNYYREYQGYVTCPECNLANYIGRGRDFYSEKLFNDYVDRKYGYRH